MNPKVNYTLVGLFVLIFGAAIVASLFWLGVGTHKKAYTTYVAYMSQSVSGLNLNAEVKLRGVEVGKVSKIAIDHENSERVRLLLDIIEGTPIKNDSIAVLSTQGLTGLAYIELSGGSKEAPVLESAKNGAYPEITTAPSLFVRMDTALTGLFVEFKNIASEISGVSLAVKQLLDENNLQSIGRSIHNMELLTTTLNTHVNNLGKHVQISEEILTDTAKMSKELPKVAKNISNGMQEIQNIITTLGNTAETMNKAVLGTQQEVSRSAADTLTQMSRLFDELQHTTRTLNRVLQDFERNPDMILFGRKSEKPGPGER